MILVIVIVTGLQELSDVNRLATVEGKRSRRFGQVHGLGYSGGEEKDPPVARGF